MPQALLANMAAMYAVYHGPGGLKTIAERVHGLAGVFSAGVGKLGFKCGSGPFFDTVKVTVGSGGAQKLANKAAEHGINMRVLDDSTVSLLSGPRIMTCDELGPFKRIFYFVKFLSESVLVNMY